MKIEFKELILHDFKGIRDFTLKFDPDLTELYADNGEGKSTILDALNYLFFGKNSFGTTKFELFPLDKDENQIPNTTPTVTLRFMNGAKENVYTRSKVGSKSVFTINDRNVTATEFKSHVNAVVTEELFSALLNPVYFGDTYSWQKQRDTIINNMHFENTIIDDFEFEEVAPKILNDGVDKVLVEYDKELKKHLKSKDQYEGIKEHLSLKLQGVSTSLSEEELVKKKILKAEEIKDAEKTLDSLHPIQNKMSELQLAIQKLENEQDKEVRIKENELKSLQTDIENEVYTAKRDLKSKITSLETEIDVELKAKKAELNTQIKTIEQDISFEIRSAKNDISMTIKGLEKEKGVIGQEYKEKVKELNEVTDVCVLCGSTLDEFAVENQRAVLQGNIDDIKVRGIKKAKEIEKLDKQLKAIVPNDEKQKQVDELKQQLSEITKDADKLEQVGELKLGLENIEQDKEKLQQCEDIRVEIEKLKGIDVSENEKVELASLELQATEIKEAVDYDKIQALREELISIDEQVKNYEIMIKDKMDLDKVRKSLRGIMEDYEECEDIIKATKQYRIDYAQMVADVLNSKLDRVKITTFEEVAEKIKETFKISMDGVPYASLNSAGKIEAGIELIMLLSQSLDITFPIVIDNKESITKKFNIPNQLITMSVREGAKLGAID